MLCSDGVRFTNDGNHDSLALQGLDDLKIKVFVESTDDPGDLPDATGSAIGVNRKCMLGRNASGEMTDNWHR